LLDRIDIHIEVPRLDANTVMAAPTGAETPDPAGV